MAEDKTLWREAPARYRAWNEAQFADRVRQAGERTLPRNGAPTWT